MMRLALLLVAVPSLRLPRPPDAQFAPMLQSALGRRHDNPLMRSLVLQAIAD